jgi:hypothetical protein
MAKKKSTKKNKKKKEDKPMKAPPVIERESVGVTMPAYRTFDKAALKRGEVQTMFMTFEDCSVRVSLGGKEVGSVEGALGGGILVKIKDEDHYFIRPADIWEAVWKRHQEYKGRC